MSRITIPSSSEAAPEASRPLLDAVKKQIGMVPNLFRLVSLSPAALEGYLALSGALAKGALPAATRERIALAVAEVNGCSYCLSAHTHLGKNLAKLDDAERVRRLGSTTSRMNGRPVPTIRASISSLPAHAYGICPIECSDDRPPINSSTESRYSAPVKLHFSHPLPRHSRQSQ